MGRRAGEGHGGVDRLTAEDQVRELGLVGPARLGEDLDRIAAGLDPRGVDQLDPHPAAFADGGQVIAGGAGVGRDDRAVLSGHGIEQTALARVGRSDQDHPGVARRPLAPRETPGDRAELGPRGFELRGQRGGGQRLDVGLVHEIEVRLEVGHQVEQPVAEHDDRLREAAGQLLEGRVELTCIPRIDHAQDRLGAGQVEPTREEGPERELAGLGMPGAPAEASGQHQVDAAAASRRCGSRRRPGRCRFAEPARGRSAPATAGGGHRGGARPAGSRRGGAGGPYRHPRRIGPGRSTRRAAPKAGPARAPPAPKGSPPPRSYPGGQTRRARCAGSTSLATSRPETGRPSLLDRPGRRDRVISSPAGSGACPGRGGLRRRPRGPCRLASRPPCDRSDPCGLLRGSSP